MDRFWAVARRFIGCLCVLGCYFASATIFTTYCFAHPITDAKSDDLYSMTLAELIELKVVSDIASFSRESELGVGSTVDIITRASFERRGAKTLQQAINAYPGLLESPSFFGNSALAIRGYTSAASDTGINMRLDGVPINSFTLGSRLFDVYALQLGTLDRIEMIRGPGSTLYGADAFHGVLSFHTFAGTSDQLALESEISGNAYRQTGMRISRAVSDAWRLNTSLAYSGQGDQNEKYIFTDNSGDTASSYRQNHYDGYMGLMRLQSQQDEQLSSEVALYYRGQDLNRFQGVGRLTGPVMYPDDTGEIDTQVGMLTAGFKLKLDNAMTLDIKNYVWRDNFERRSSSFIPDTTLAELHGGSRIHLTSAQSADTTQWLVGYEFAYMKVLEARNGSTPEPVEDRLRRVNSAIFQAKTPLLQSRIQLLYGLRYDYYSDANAHFSPRTGVIFNPTKTSAIKLLYGNAFRPPTAAEMSGSSLAGPANGAAEEIDTYELVFMRHSREYRVNLVLFKSIWQDAILLVANTEPSPPLARSNFGENEATGIEMSLNRVGSILRFDVSGSYVRSRDVTADQEYIAFPETILNIGVGVNLKSVRTRIYLHNRAHFNTYSGPVTVFVDSPERLDDYWRTDLTLTWYSTKQQHEIYLNFQNLLNQENYFPSAASAEGGIADTRFSASLGLRLKY